MFANVIGPKLRKLRKSLECSTAEALGILIMVWLFAQENADETGELKYVEEEDLASYLIGQNVGTKVNMENAISAMVETGWIDYSNDTFFVHDWFDWQKPWFKAMEKRNNDKDRKRNSRDRIPEVEEDYQSADVADTEVKKKSRIDYPVPFEIWWKEYPRQIDKGNAYKKYHARLNDGYSEEQLLIAAKNYATQCRINKTDAQYIKHPKTFLSDSCPFLDYIPKQEEAIEDGENPF